MRRLVLGPLSVPNQLNTSALDAVPFLPYPRQVAPLALAFVGYIVLGNLNLKVNTVSFYQITKIAVAPAVLAIDFILYRRVPSVPIAASVAVVCVGIGFATVSELEGAHGIQGAVVGLGAVLSTALYQARYPPRFFCLFNSFPFARDADK